MTYLLGQSLAKHLTAIILAASTCVAATSAIAESGEQFSLNTKPTVLFDGGSGNLTGKVNGISYSIVQGYAVAQGDMVLGQVQANGRLELKLQQRGVGQAAVIDRWPDGIIPYEFEEGLTQIQRDRALEAIAHWNMKTSIKIIARTDETNYVAFSPNSSCASYVGRIGGMQEVWIGASCTTGSIIHEIGHAIGLFHEHTRADRDNFISINLDNVKEAAFINYDKVEEGVDTYSDYDFGSIMHYGEYFFTKNGEATITVPDGVEVGQREALSALDISSIENMYATDLKLDVTTEAVTSREEETARVDILVSNIGSLGANTLTLTASIAGDADWLSISKDSGWDCQQFGTELICNRPTLIENTDSSFTVLVGMNSSSIEDLKIRVESATLDVELNNNTFNDVIPEKDASEETEESTPNDDGTEENGEGSTSNEQTTGSNQVPLVESEPTETQGKPEENNTTPAGSSDSGSQESGEAIDNAPSEGTTTEGTPTDGSPTDENANNGSSDQDSDAEGSTPELAAAKDGGSGGGSAGFYLLFLLAAFRLRMRSVAGSKISS